MAGCRSRRRSRRRGQVGLALVIRADWMADALQSGCCWRSRAATPVTCGVAIDVPLLAAAEAIGKRQYEPAQQKPADAIRLAERLVNQDVPEPEVMLEVEVLEVKRSRLMELGAAWPSGVTLSPISTTGGAMLTLADLRNLNQRSVGVGGVALSVNASHSPEAQTSEFAAGSEGSSRRRPLAGVKAKDRLPAPPPAAPAPPTEQQADPGPAPIQVGLAEPGPEQQQGGSK